MSRRPFVHTYLKPIAIGLGLGLLAAFAVSVWRLNPDLPEIPFWDHGQAYMKSSAARRFLQLQNQAVFLRFCMTLHDQGFLFFAIPVMVSLLANRLLSRKAAVPTENRPLTKNVLDSKISIATRRSLKMTAIVMFFVWSIGIGCALIFCDNFRLVDVIPCTFILLLFSVVLGISPGLFAVCFFCNVACWDNLETRVEAAKQ